MKNLTRYKDFQVSMHLFLGVLFLLLAGIGTILPVLPTVPFLLAAAWCLKKSSATRREKLAGIIARFSEGRFSFRDGMTAADKYRILIPVIALLVIAFIASDSLVIKVIIALAAGIKIIFFMKIKTLK